jgi:AIR synthase-related protein
MKLGGRDLRTLVCALQQSEGLLRKQDVRHAASAFAGLPTHIRNGDDAAAIPHTAGYTLIAAEGMSPAFVNSDPFFAGFCAVMTNVSDIAAMGGRAQAIVDVLFSGADPKKLSAVIEGLAAGAKVFDVPIVGGHTARSGGDLYLAAAVVGHARSLISSFDAEPGDVILACIDLRGQFRGDTTQFDAVSGRPPAELRAQLALLPALAEAGLVCAGKDISMAGLPGTLLMLLETSGCGALLHLAAVPAPDPVDPVRWLQAFPSYGYLLSVSKARVRELNERFLALGVETAVIAEVRDGSVLEIEHDGQIERYWDHAKVPLVGHLAAASRANDA